MQPTLSVRNLSIEYRARRGQVQAIRNVSFDVMRGQAMALIGESGSGMFNLPALDDLARRRRLVWRDVQRIGEDLRVVARFGPTA